MWCSLALSAAGIIARRSGHAGSATSVWVRPPISHAAELSTAPAPDLVDSPAALTGHLSYAVETAVGRSRRCFPMEEPCSDVYAGSGKALLLAGLPIRAAAGIIRPGGLLP